MPTDKLINALYDLAVDPLLFEQFTEALDQFTKDSDIQLGNGIGDQLQGHFERAFSIMEKMGRSKGKQKPVIQMVLERSGPSVGIDQNGKILYYNNSATEALDNACINSYLFELVHRKSRDSLQRAIKKVIEFDRAIPVLVLLKNKHPCLFILKRNINSGQILVDFTGSIWADEVSDFLIQTHRLSNAEIEVTKCLYQGLSLNEIAKSSDRSKETIRKHLSSILSKTGCRTQAELMRLITGINFSNENSDQPRWFKQGTKLLTHTLKDGRDLVYCDTGGDSQLIMVVMHPVLRTPELPKELKEKILAKGYRIIGICRAGYGNSSLVPKKQDAIECAVNDFDELMTFLGIEKVLMLGVMGGSVHCYQAAVKFPERIVKIINISGTVPVFSEKQINRLPMAARSLAFTIRYFPKLFPFFARSAVALIDSGDANKLVNSFYRDSPVDLKCAQEKDVQQWIMRGCQFCTYRGHTTYVKEMQSVANLIIDYERKIKCPVTLIHSDNDCFVFYDRVLELNENFKQFTLKTIKNSGHLMLYISTKEVTDEIIESL